MAKPRKREMDALRRYMRDVEVLAGKGEPGGTSPTVARWRQYLVRQILALSPAEDDEAGCTAMRRCLLAEGASAADIQAIAILLVRSAVERLELEGDALHAQIAAISHHLVLEDVTVNIDRAGEVSRVTFGPTTH
jgi:hypothetical protein